MDYHHASFAFDCDSRGSATQCSISLVSFSTRQTLSHVLPQEEEKEEEIERYINAVVVPALPASPRRLEVYRQAQKVDRECVAVRQYCAEGWPEKHKVDPALIPYWKEQAALTICEDLLLYNGR